MSPIWPSSYCCHTWVKAACSAHQISKSFCILTLDFSSRCWRCSISVLRDRRRVKLSLYLTKETGNVYPTNSTQDKSRNYVTVCASRKVKLKFFKFFVWNRCQSSPSLTILVSLRYNIISLVFFCLSSLLFSTFHQFKADFVSGQNYSKCRDWAPLKSREAFHCQKIAWSILSLTLLFPPQ